MKIFSTALKLLGVEGEEAVMIGDNIQSDMLPSKAMGMQPIWYNRDGINQSDYSGEVINKLSEVLELL